MLLSALSISINAQNMENPNLNTSLPPVENLNLTQAWTVRHVGKSYHSVCNFRGSEYDETEKDLVVSAPKAVFKPGKVLNEMNKQQIQEWINTFKENE